MYLLRKGAIEALVIIERFKSGLTALSKLKVNAIESVFSEMRIAIQDNRLYSGWYHRSELRISLQAHFLRIGIESNRPLQDSFDKIQKGIFPIQEKEQDLADPPPPNPHYVPDSPGPKYRPSSDNPNSSNIVASLSTSQLENLQSNITEILNAIHELKPITDRYRHSKTKQDQE